MTIICLCLTSSCLHSTWVQDQKITADYISDPHKQMMKDVQNTNGCSLDVQHKHSTSSHQQLPDNAYLHYLYLISHKNVRLFAQERTIAIFLRVFIKWNLFEHLISLIRGTGRDEDTLLLHSEIMKTISETTSDGKKDCEGQLNFSPLSLHLFQNR